MTEGRDINPNDIIVELKAALLDRIVKLPYCGSAAEPACLLAKQIMDIHVQVNKPTVHEWRNCLLSMFTHTHRTSHMSIRKRRCDA